MSSSETFLKMGSREKDKDVLLRLFRFRGFFLHYVGGLRAFVALHPFKTDHIAFFQSFIPFPLNGRIVNKYIWPALLLYKPVALHIGKPLHLTAYCHFILPNLFDFMFQNEARLEHDHFFLRDLNFLARARIASHTTS